MSSVSGFFKTNGGIARVWVLLSALSVTSTALAQTTGGILGTVRDQTGAVVPGASVTIRNVETGTVRRAVSGTAGEYRAPNLAVGTYEVQVEQAGFQTSVRQGITLTIGREAVVDFNLQVGNVAEQVTVTEEAPLIETTSATVGGVVDPQQIRQIPLNSRSFLELAPLQAGVTITETGEKSATKGFGAKLSVSGTRAASHSFLLDGSRVNDGSDTIGSAAGTLAGVETVREFRVITNAYDAEYGRHSGAVVVAVTRSGTNEFHGSAFEFLRNDNFDARNFFDRDPENPLERSDPPQFARNQFGGTFGGPIVPDKVFFFTSYEALRERLGQTKFSDVPGTAMRQGILPLGASACTNLSGTNLGDGRCQLPVAAGVRPFLDTWPAPSLPDRPDGTAQLIRSESQSTGQDTGTVRVDYQLSPSDSLFGRFNIDRADVREPQGSGVNYAQVTATSSRYATAQLSHIFSPRWLSQTHASFVRTLIDQDRQLHSEYTVPQVSFGANPDIAGEIDVPGLTIWGADDRTPRGSIQNSYQLRQDLNFTSGRHTVKFGGSIDRAHFNQSQFTTIGGIFVFGSLADFIVNDVQNFQVATPASDPHRGWRQTVVGLYIQDDFRVTQNFMLNLGLRYEPYTVPTEVNGKIATVHDLRPHVFNRTSPEDFFIGDPLFLNPSLKNFAPRIGMAWDLFGSGRTSIRAGAGFFPELMTNSQIIVPGYGMPPFYDRLELLGDDFNIQFPNAWFTQPELFRSGTARSRPNTMQWNPEGQPIVYKWSMDVQHEVLRNTTVETGYSGTRGVHLGRGATNRNVTPSEIRNGRRFYLVEQPLPNPFFSRFRAKLFDGTSDYHGLRFVVNRRLTSGLQVHGAYTFSKATDDHSGWASVSDYEGDLQGYAAEKIHALSSYDIRHSFYSSFTYDVPGANLPGVVGKILGGWSMTGLLRLNSGVPISLLADQPRQGSLRLQNVDGRRVDLVAGGDQNPVRPQNPDEYYDVSQFAFPTRFFEGNLGRNTLLAPGIAKFDFTLVKSTGLPIISENTNLQFRAEFFNLFNRANFGLPAYTVFDRNGRGYANAGEITRTTTSSRQIQLALKLVF